MSLFFCFPPVSLFFAVDQPLKMTMSQERCCAQTLTLKKRRDRTRSPVPCSPPFTGRKVVSEVASMPQNSVRRYLVSLSVGIKRISAQRQDALLGALQSIFTDRTAARSIDTTAEKLLPLSSAIIWSGVKDWPQTCCHRMSQRHGVLSVITQIILADVYSTCEVRNLLADADEHMTKLIIQFLDVNAAHIVNPRSKLVFFATPRMTDAKRIPPWRSHLSSS